MAQLAGHPGRRWHVGAVGLVALALISGCSLVAGDKDPAAEPDKTPSTSGEALSASVSATLDPLAPYYDQNVTWTDCGGKFDCTNVNVPLDYQNPSGDSIELAVVRLKSAGPLGSLLLNPGGPGASGVEYARYARSALTPDVVKSYDIVGFDPRGVVGSAPVDCVTDEQLDEYFATDATPDSPAEQAKIVAVNASFGKGCAAKSPQIGSYIDTQSAARDMDIIRAVLGDEKLNLLGKSYGTFLGAQYAELFPDRVGRMVLDGAMPSALDSEELGLGQAKAFDVSLRRFIADCLPREDCPLSGTVDQGVVQIADFLQSLDSKPIPGIGSRKLNEALATYAIVSFMYVWPSDWEVLRYGLAAGMAGDGSVLMQMMDERTSRNSDGSFEDNSNEAFPAISCLDRPALGGKDRAIALSREWAAQAPVFGEYFAWSSLVCWNWPLGQGPTELKPVTAKGSSPLLVVSTKYDPATPYEWGVEVAKELENAALLTYDADGHTAYTSGSECVDNVVDDYLIKGVMPADGVVCKPDGA